MRTVVVFHCNDWYFVNWIPISRTRSRAARYATQEFDITSFIAENALDRTYHFGDVVTITSQNGSVWTHDKILRLVK